MHSQMAISVQCQHSNRISVVDLERIGRNCMCGSFDGVTAVLMTYIDHKVLYYFMYCSSCLRRTGYYESGW